MAIFGVMAIIGSFCLVFYEGEAAVELYCELYGDGFLGDFYGMINAIRYCGIRMLIVGGILFVLGKKVGPQE